MRETRRLLSLACVLVVLAALAVPARGQSFEPASGGSAIVREVIDGDTLVVEIAKALPAMPGTAREESEAKVRLVGIQAPKLPLGRPGFKAWPLAEEAKSALASLTLGKELRLSFTGARLDRHGRLLAHLHRPDGTWIQGEMLRRGFARVYSFADNLALIPEMLALEREARSKGLGIWAHPFYAVRQADQAARFTGGFQLVEGRVREVAARRSRVYLNFGADWRSDFTVAIGPEARPLFKRAGLEPANLEGKRIRVRGWVKSFNGPLVEATHPEQIEVLGE